MRSTNVWPSFIFTCGLLLVVNLFAGCESESASKLAPSENSSQVASTEDSPAPTEDSSTPSEDSSEPIDSSLLTIGSTAPSLDIEHWISNGNGRFEEVTKFEQGKVYVVEFWATWCGPCIRSMPHLVEIQNTFADQGVQIISVSDEDLDTVESMLSKPFKSEEADGPATYGELTSAYCLTTDPDESVKNSYFRAAQQTGIPCAFIVGKSGVIEWIGHPAGMDDSLQQIVDDKWDRKQFAKAFKAKKEVDTLSRKVMILASRGNLDEANTVLSEGKEKLGEAASEPLKELETRLALVTIGQMVKAEQFDDAIAAMEGLRETSEGRLAAILDTRLIILLVEQGRFPKAATKLNGALDSLPPSYLNQIASGIYQHAAKPNEISDELRDAAIAAVEKSLETKPDNGAALDTLAHLHHLAGDLDQAIEVQNKAVLNPGNSKSGIEKFLEQLLKEKAERDAT